MMHKAWRSIEEVPYCFSRSSIKLYGHTGGKIDDLNRIWDYLAGRSYQILQICLVTKLIYQNCDSIAWKSAIECDGKSMMTDNNLNMKEILKLLIFNYIISDYLWSNGDHSISTLIHLFIIYLFIYLIHNISTVPLCSVKACHLIKLSKVNLSPEAFS